MKLNIAAGCKCLLFGFAAFLVGACSRSICPRTSTAPASWLSSPRKIQLEILVQVAIEEVLKGEALARENSRLGLPADLPPQLMFWSSDLRNHLGQQGVELVECNPPPANTVNDAENGNRILNWDLSKDLQSGTTITLHRVYNLTLNAFNRPIDEKSFGDYDLSAPQVAFYTKSEPFLEQTAEISQAAREAVGGEVNPWAKARLIFRWVRKHMVYKYPPPGGRGATIALREGRGDCGQYADLFIAMCRSAGVPARFVGGFALNETQPGQPPVVGSHAWAEILLPDGSWVPVDPTGEEEGYFGRCKVNTHITSSVGRNILLPNAPVWATYQFSDVQEARTEFMQTVTELKTGVKASVKIERKASQR